MSTFKLPELGEGLSEGEVVAWKVKEGDTVKADQPLVEIMTDKATVEVPSPRAGVVKKLYYKPGQMAKVHGPLVDFEDVGGSSAKADSSTANAEAEKSAPAATSAKSAEKSPSRNTNNVTPLPSARGPVKPETARVLASPAVRKRAREMELDLSTIQGSGDHGRVLQSDLEGAGAHGSGSSVYGAASGQTAGSSALAPVGASRSLPATQRQVPALEERVPFIGIRRKISDKLAESAFTAVHFTHVDECDFTEIMRLRDEMNEFAEKNKMGVKLSYLPFFIKASIAALRKYPILNSTLDTETNEVVIKHYYNFGISIQTDNGLMVGVIRDCDQKDIYTIAKELKEVADRARAGKASLQELSGSTITITNPGNIGGLFATPIINFPETVILGMYQIKKRAVVRSVDGEDAVVARPMMYVNITCDHRIIDGALAAGYLRLFCDYIENPAKIAFVS